MLSGSLSTPSAKQTFTPVVDGDFESISSAVGTGSSGVITFSSIPQTYKHLQLRCTLKDVYTTSAVEGVYFRVNGTAGTSYAYHQMDGNGTSTTSSASSSSSEIFVRKAIPSGHSDYANLTGVMTVDILNYTSTSQLKTFRILNAMERNSSDTNSIVGMASGLFSSTAAITQITVHTNADRFATTTKISLYGIKGA